MKRRLLVLLMALTAITAPAQIKISENLNTEIRSLSKPDLVSKRLVPLEEIHIKWQNYSFSYKENPIGCGVYVLSDEIGDGYGNCTIYKHPCMSFNDSTLTFKPLSPGEYKISDIIRFKEHFNRWTENLSRAIDSSKSDIKRFMSWLEPIAPNLITVDDFILNPNVKPFPCQYIYILTNSLGEEYYLIKNERFNQCGSGRGKVIYKYGSYATVNDSYATVDYDSYRLILLPYYEKATKLIGGNCAIIGKEDSTCKDLTGNLFVLKDVEFSPWFTNSRYERRGLKNVKIYESNRNKYTFYKCKDVTVYKEQVSAIFESSKGDTFALALFRLDKGGSYSVFEGYEDIYRTSAINAATLDISILPEKRFIELEAWIKNKELEDAKEQAKKKEAEMQRRTELIAKYGDIDGNNIADREVSIGMTKGMCEDAWGKYHETYTTITEGRKTELWVYDHKTSLYFENGILWRIEK